ncbi:MAG: T9SS type A sorting domain-containing protein [FCB group bacterium]|nr:T9SS type A sorting domain-containing protein [FCB group bacterium]
MNRVLLIIIAILSAVTLSSAQTIPWFYEPTNQAHPLGNNYMEFQDYSGGYSSYYHDGIDAMSGYGGRNVFSVSDGVLNHITTGTMYGGLMIGQRVSNGEGWLYWHIPSNSMQFGIGDSVYTGDYIGDVANWSVYSFHHVHFNKIHGTGGYPWNWYTSIDNPLNFMDPIDDRDAPYFQDAVTGQKFAFCQNNTSVYLPPNSLFGQIDIIANIGDIIGDPDWPENPFEIWYWINGPVSIDPICSFIATGLCPGDNTINVCYQEDNTCLTQGNYTARNYYFNLTNTDGDSIIESTDTGNAWNTDLMSAGDYWIYVEAKDRFGNTTLDSMMVTLSGGPELSITMTPENPPIVIPAAGSSFSYTVTIENTGGSPASYDAWIMVELPNGSLYGPVLQRNNMFLAAGGSLSRTLTQNVPGQAPEGDYQYIGRIGDYPSVIMEESSFGFSKSGLLTSAGSQWNLSGWNDDAVNPVKYDLMRISPNPFNPETEISFYLSEPGRLSLTVYNTLGRRIATLAEGYFNPGDYSYNWDAAGLSSGIYLVTLDYNNQIQTDKMLLLK